MRTYKFKVEGVETKLDDSIALANIQFFSIRGEEREVLDLFDDVLSIFVIPQGRVSFVSDDSHNDLKMINKSLQGLTI